MQNEVNLIDINYYNNLLKQIEEEEKQKVKRTLEQVAKDQLGRTLEYRGQTKENGFRDAKVSVLFIDRRNGFKAVIQVVDKSNKPHKVWHYLNAGTRDRVVDNPFAFRKRIENRTNVRDLDAKTFKGYDGWASKKKGDVVKGIESRDWYELAADEIEQEMSSVTKNFYLQKDKKVEN